MNNITINSISLNLDEWELRENTESIKAWYNEYGDKLSINFFSKRPDLPEDAVDIRSLRYFYRDKITKAKGAIVEVEKEYLDSLLAIKTIVKFPQNPTGFTFIASYTIPRVDCSFVLKVQCPERGMTGIRETIILDKALGEGLVEMDGVMMKGWFFDPYDPEFKAPILSNIADREEYDKQFPKHPLSRVRNSLKIIKEKVEFSEDLINSNKFFLNFE